MKRKNNKKGFTLVELVVVIAVIAILAGVSVATYFGVVENAHKSTDEQTCKQYNDLLAIERVNDNDITLPELIGIIESNGLNANDFKTNSKAYTFAYDRANFTTVLLDGSGQVAFPKGYTPSSDGLWAAIKGSEQIVVNEHIQNYALLGSSIYLTSDANIIGANNNFRLDLNGNSFSVGKGVTLKDRTIKVENGYYLYDSARTKLASKLANVTADTAKGGKEVDITTDKNVQFNESSTGSGFTFTNTETGKSFFNSYVNKKNGNESVPTINITKKGQTFTYKDCVFSGVALLIEDKDVTDVKFENCKFVAYPFGSYPLTINTPNANVTVTGCTFDNAVRGINSASMNAGHTFTLENNTFNLTTKLTAKVEEKSNALQIAYITTAGSTSNVGKWVINNNTVVRGKALVSIHDSMGKSYEELKGTFTKDKFTLSGNKLDGAKGTVSIDPGYKEVTDSTQRETLRANLFKLGKEVASDVIE